MPGENCAIVGCGASRTRCKGLSFFAIQHRKNPEWQQALVRAVNRSDASFNQNRATICSRHFTPECFKTTDSGRFLIPGSLPTVWMPQKSIETTKPPERKAPMERTCTEPPICVKYYNFDEVRQAATKLPGSWFLISSSESECVVGTLADGLLRFKVRIQSDYTVTLSVFGFPAKQLTTNIESISVSSFCNRLDSWHVCPGVCDPSLQEYASLPNSQKTQLYFRHIVCMPHDDTVKHTSTVRAIACQMLLSTNSLCQPCTEIVNLLKKKKERSDASMSADIKQNNPLRSVPTDKLIVAFKSVRKQNKDIEKQLEDFRKTVSNDNESIELSSSLHTSLKTVMEQNKIEDPLKKLFWEEQIKAFQCSDKRGMRWHPMLIRMAILLHSRSPAAYETLRKTGVLQLPGASTLRDYSNVYHPQTGFCLDVVNEIKNAAKDFKDNERYVILLHDEMTIKSDLVFDRRSGEVVGFVKDMSHNNPELASHALVFYVVGVNTNLSTSLGFFGTQTATADALFPLFWKAIGLLERICQLKVVASTSDKASPNQRLYSMHGVTNEICYKATNLFAKDREVFFFSDAPHLVKTVRNNLSNSGFGKKSRYLWLNQHHMLWQHIVDVYNTDARKQLRETKLTAEHVYLTPSSTMSVKLAVQVLSESVAKIMMKNAGPACQETGKFILMIDKFFDCLNTRSETEGIRKRKPYLLPYTSVNDDRFSFLQEVLNFFIQWKDSIQKREGFTQVEKNKMFISHQTFKGMYMTLKSFPEVTKYLLNHGVQCVFSNRFCQDPLEAHFGRQQGLGRRNDNPNLWAFGYNETKLRLQRNLALVIEPRGSVATKRKAEICITNSPLKKIKRH